MCGIAGYVNRDRERAASLDRAKKMASVVRHRGPDAEGFYVSGHVALAHRRLSIIDLLTGDQPMLTPDETVIVCYNGEIYNYIELREELSVLGFDFKTDSDTEVILHAYRAWDLDFQRRLNGMWAFALWDHRLQRLVLSRDRFGEKPLHYAFTYEALIFASEMKSIFAYGHKTEKDFRWTEVFGALGYIPAPHTFFKGVQKLSPASFLVYENDAIRVARYWDLPEIDERRMRTDREAIEAEFEEVFKDSVRIRMRADVPYGAFLSGGLDSTSVVSAMSSLMDTPVRTFTIGFESRRHDERVHAREVARRFKTEHRERVVESEVFEDALARIIRHFDEPFGDSSAIPVGYVSRDASAYVKMVLTGDGGDEALSGYTVYQGEKFAQSFGRIPHALRRGLPALLDGVSRVAPSRLRLGIARARNVVETSNMSFEDRLVRKFSWESLSTIRELFADFGEQVRVDDLIRDLMRPCPYRDNFYRLMYFNLKVSLPDDMLVKVDRMSMAYSLEVRTPFLDHRLVELLVGVDKDVKLPGYQRKSILRNTVGKRLPPSLLRAPKRGFAVPVGEWFKGREFEHYVNELMGAEGLPYKRRVLERIIDDNTSGRRDMGNFLWILLLLQRFC